MSFLELDRSEFEKSLIVNENFDGGQESVDSLLESYVTGKCPVPTKVITPIPGYCVKTRTRRGDKIFINVCHTEHVPMPKGVTVPMSIGHQREVEDKGGQPCAAFDVAVNSEFFDKLNPNNECMMGTIIEAVAQKYGLDLILTEFRILKNIKMKGKIQPMNIEQRPLKPDPSKRPLICEIESEPTETKRPEKKVLVPKFNLMKIDQPHEYYASEIDLKNVLSKDEVCLKLNEDRLCLITSGAVNYKLEYHFPLNVDVDSCSAEFDQDEQILTIVAPLQ